MKPINIKAMVALVEKEPGDQYVPVLKPVLMQILTELKHLRRKNSQLLFRCQTVCRLLP